MEKRLFVLAGGAEKGPFGPAEIEGMARAGKLAAHDFLCREGDTRWVPAGSVKTLADLFDDISPARQRIEALFEEEEVDAPASTCPQCRAPTDGDAAFCTVCGAVLAAEDPEPATDVCAHCGRALAPDAYFCTGCGRCLDGVEAPAPEIPPRRTGASPEKPPREDYPAAEQIEGPGDAPGRRRVFAFAGVVALVAAVALVAGVAADRYDNGDVDGSLLGYGGDAGESTEASVEDAIAPAGEEPGAEPAVSFEVLSAYGGGRARRDVMDGLAGREGRLAAAFAGGEGEVVARITVARSGAVVKAEVVRSSLGEPASADKVASALRACKLEAAAGTTVAVVRIEYGE